MEVKCRDCETKLPRHQTQEHTCQPDFKRMLAAQKAEAGELKAQHAELEEELEDLMA